MAPGSPGVISCFPGDCRTIGASVFTLVGMPRTSTQIEARAAARQRQAAADEPELARKRTELDLATAFEVARRRRSDAAAAVVGAEIEMGLAVQELFELGNPAGRVAIVTGETEVEVKRLRKLAADARPTDTGAGIDTSPAATEATDSAAGRATKDTDPADTATGRTTTSVATGNG
jgi:hypothetical protein